MVELKFAPKTMEQSLFRFIESKTAGTIYEIKYHSSFDTEPEDKDDDTYVSINDTTLPPETMTDQGCITNTLIDFCSEDFNIKNVKKELTAYSDDDDDDNVFLSFMYKVLTEYERIDDSISHKTTKAKKSPVIKTLEDLFYDLPGVITDENVMFHFMLFKGDRVVSIRYKSIESGDSGRVLCETVGTGLLDAITKMKLLLQKGKYID